MPGSFRGKLSMDTESAQETVIEFSEGIRKNIRGKKNGNVLSAAEQLLSDESFDTSLEKRNRQ